MADLKPCPLTQIPTEILQVIASRLDKTSLSALRLTGREVKERIEFVFKGGFREIKHNILDCEYDDDDLCAFIMKDLEFLKTEYPSKVEVVTWVVKFALFDDPLPSPLHHSADSPLEYCICHLLRSHQCFDNLKTLRLPSYFELIDVKEVKTADYALATLDCEIERMLRVLRCLFEHCSQRALKVELEVPGFFLCTVMWTGELQTTGDIKLQSLIEHPIDVNGSDQPVGARAEQLWFETALLIFCWDLEVLLGHPFWALHLSGFTMRPIDLVRLCNGDEDWPGTAPETLIFESCTMLSNNRGHTTPHHTTIDTTPSDIHDLRDAVSCVKHVGFLKVRATPEFLDIEAELANQGFNSITRPTNAWEYFFGLLADDIKTPAGKTVLQSLRFEHVDGVCFDWDDDGQLDHGERLPQIINQLGFQGAMRKMAQCSRGRDQASNRATPPSRSA
ncbi:hypothetical protein IWZ01DRAFT_135809 [Phyllosticta capitalensis]